MKSIVAPNAQRIVLILAIATLAAVPAIAKEGSWKLDADHSTARILLGTNAFNIGVARVGGNVELNGAEPTKAVLDLSVESAGSKLITFKSRRTTIGRDGRLEVSGDLTLRVVRRINLDPAEDYYGPADGQPITRTVTREVTFVLPMSDGGNQAEVTAEANIFRESFPELFAAVTDANWQPVIQDKTCELPQAGEGYAGAVCSGTVVAPDRSASFASIGEDYHGFESGAPDASLVRIVLKLRLTRENPEQAITAKNLH
jgi:hypothetical protein